MRKLSVVALARLAVVVALLAAPSVLAAGYTQICYDAARSCSSGEPGPKTDDIALRVSLESVWIPGGGSWYTPHDATQTAIWRVYVGTADQSLKTTQPARIVRVDLATGEVRKVADLDSAIGNTAVADGRLYSEFYGLLRTYDLATGSLLWRVEPQPAAPGLLDGCQQHAVDAGTLYVACYHSKSPLALGRAPVPIGVVNIGPGPVDVRAIDAATGTIKWKWSEPAQAGPTDEGLPLGIAVAKDRLLVVVARGGAPQDAYLTSTMWALDLTNNGHAVWQQTLSDTNVTTYRTDNTPDANGAATQTLPLAAVGANGYFAANDLLRLDIMGRGTTLARRSFAQDPAQPGYYARYLAIGQGVVYVTTPTMLHKLDAISLRPIWEVPAPPNEYYSGVEMSLDQVVAYTRPPNPGSVGPNVISNVNLNFLDPSDGRLLWRREMPNGGRTVLANEFVVVFENNQTDIIGTTSASIVPAPAISTAYPAVGAAARVDLSATRPGVFGAATAFRADWGDGAVADWQPSTHFEHAYATAGDRTARFQARNDANQSASAFATFHVGAPEPTFFSVAFDAEHQNTTFFILGLAVTAVGGAFGITRLSARRRRLGRELRAIDDVFQATKGDPPRCEAALAERRARTLGLVADGKLDEAQAGVLERRIESLARELRLSAVDERFQYLPLGMVEQLRGMLADGRVTRWEREHFDTALDRERTMSDDQKARVRALVDGWFSRDSGEAL